MLKLLLLATELPLVDILAQLKHLKVRLYSCVSSSVPNRIHSEEKLISS